MEIIVKGKEPNDNTEIFKCQNCGCIFREDLDRSDYYSTAKQFG